LAAADEAGKQAKETTGTIKGTKKNKAGQPKVTLGKGDYEIVMSGARRASDFQKENTTLKKEAAKKDKELDLRNAQLAQLEADKEELARRIAALERATSNKARKKSPKLNKDLKDHITLNKHVYFRKWKFITNETQRDQCTAEVYDYLTINTELTKEEFVASYGEHIRKVINTERNYLQSQAKKAVKGTFFFVFYVKLIHHYSFFVRPFTQSGSSSTRIFRPRMILLLL